VAAFIENRPFVSILEFRWEISHYVDDSVIAGYEQYVYVPVNINESDPATLMQIPGVDETVAESLIAARPFDDNEAFLAALADLSPDVDIDYKAHFLEAE